MDFETTVALALSVFAMYPDVQTDDDLLEVKRATYSQFADMKRITMDIERRDLTDKWKKRKQKKLMLEDPIRWILETRQPQ